MPDLEPIRDSQLEAWVSAIPMPLYGPRNKCLVCGAKFWTLDGYRGHYALKHGASHSLVEALERIAGARADETGPSRAEIARTALDNAGLARAESDV